MQYENCTTSQVDIVEQLLCRGPEALEIETKTTEGTQSIFQFHEESRRKGQANYESRRDRNRADRDRRRHQADPGPDGAKAELKEVDNWGKRQSMGPPQRPLPKGKPEANTSLTRTSSGLLSGYENHESTHISADVDMQLASPYQLGLPPKSTSQMAAGIDTGEAEKKEELERRDAAEKISEKLKLLCLRKRKPDQVSRILRIPGNKKGLHSPPIFQMYGF